MYISGLKTCGERPTYEANDKTGKYFWRCFFMQRKAVFSSSQHSVASSSCGAVCDVAARFRSKADLC
jgi:hypothetical protein